MKAAILGDKIMPSLLYIYSLVGTEYTQDNARALLICVKQGLAYINCWDEKLDPELKIIVRKWFKELGLNDGLTPGQRELVSKNG